MKLVLSFLGAFAVKRNAQVISHFRSANVQGLLVYLVMLAERPFATTPPTSSPASPATASNLKSGCVGNGKGCMAWLCPR